MFFHFRNIVSSENDPDPHPVLVEMAVNGRLTGSSERLESWKNHSSVWIHTRLRYTTNLNQKFVANS